MDIVNDLFKTTTYTHYENWQGRHNPETHWRSTSVACHFSTQLDLVVPAEVIEYLETFIRNDSKGLAVLSKNKYELMEFDIDARFYK